MFEDNIKIGKLRTELAIDGMEKNGPIASAKEILKLINGEI